MPRRSAVGPDDVAELSNLTAAFWRAARGRRQRPEVAAMARDLGGALSKLSDDIRDGLAPGGPWTRFTIHDPKERSILAPCFRDRVVHHALMAKVGPVLDRGLIDDTYACRERRGTLAAVRRAQRHARRFPWFVKTDIRAYFASIDHGILRTILARRFKHPGLLALLDRVMETAPHSAGVGLPIGALTSQHFANVYLDGTDRLLLEDLRVPGMVRYMDDLIWWCESHGEARRTLAFVRDHVWRTRRLEVKPNACIGRSSQGVPFLGFHVLPGPLRLLRRRRVRFAAARARWERRWMERRCSARELQAGVDAALAITAHADAVSWRRNQLRRRPPVDA